MSQLLWQTVKNIRVELDELKERVKAIEEKEKKEPDKSTTLSLPKHGRQ